MHAKKQKLLRTGKEVKPPKKKASAFVKEVIEIDGPACIMP